MFLQLFTDDVVEIRLCQFGLTSDDTLGSYTLTAADLVSLAGRKTDVCCRIRIQFLLAIDAYVLNNDYLKVE